MVAKRKQNSTADNRREAAIAYVRRTDRPSSANIVVLGYAKIPKDHDILHIENLLIKAKADKDAHNLVIIDKSDYITRNIIVYTGSVEGLWEAIREHLNKTGDYIYPETLATLRGHLLKQTSADLPIIAMDS
jgi:hypothetical protein